ncbi:MAG: hypothetical protein NC827_05895 [Candidatus Omnitrophica bacterium]|nr:hypothetical protein [Candidatus Omnitrophota bacterium]
MNYIGNDEWEKIEKLEKEVNEIKRKIKLMEEDIDFIYKTLKSIMY